MPSVPIFSTFGSASDEQADRPVAATAASTAAASSLRTFIPFSTARIGHAQARRRYGAAADRHRVSLIVIAIPVGKRETGAPHPAGHP
ncbi:hypothetical protein NN3_33210 [Nocardia neocaledoniensis NBRC 108232]|nr:hypothetical protein NN3_33210 [Nocardia neocaledoniensis NBRC 108232]